MADLEFMGWLKTESASKRELSPAWTSSRGQGRLWRKGVESGKLPIG